MGNPFSKEKNDPKIELIYKLAKGEIEPSEDLELLKSFKSEAYNWTLLHLAVWFSNKSLVEKLLKYNYEINSQDYHGESALHLAAYQNNQEIYRLLLDNNADRELKNRENKTASELLSANKC